MIDYKLLVFFSKIKFSKEETLSAKKNEKDHIEVYFSNEKNNIVINNPTSRLIESVEMFNILGQALFKLQPNTNNNHLEYNANQIKAGNYILKIETELLDSVIILKFQDNGLGIPSDQHKKMFKIFERFKR